MYYYDQIIEKEKYWTLLLEKGLLNIYYIKCSGGLRDFYISKIREINGYLMSDQLEEMKKIKMCLENMVNKIDIMIAKHKNNEKYNISDIANYFLINIKKSENDSNGVDRIEVKSEVLKAVNNYYKNNMPPMENIIIN